MSKLRFTLMGCGSSGGVPLGPNWWGECDPSEPRNRRQRAAAFIQSDTTDILIDAGPDIRRQLVDCKHEKIDHLILTHEHSDHVAGLDDLRFYVYHQKAQMPVTTLQRTADAVQKRLPHVFETMSPLYPALFDMQTVPQFPHKVTIGDIDLEFFEQPHGDITSLGVIVADTLVYSTDCVNLSDETLDMIASKNPEIWIVDAAVKRPHYSHSHIDQSLEWIRRVGAKHNVLTHLGHFIDYGWLKDLTAEMDPKTEPAYDGMTWTFDGPSR